ncbi:MAG: tRNA lysidine(34) synthetase TilS [Bacteroidota bacterium]
MLKDFNTFILKNQLFEETDRIILAVSGGIDSMTMLDLFSKTDNEFCIAHCNFKLRGKESDYDELFVKKVASENDIPFYSKSFNTKQYAEKNKISIQMAARELRYSWFEHLLKKLSYEYVAVAHNADDVVETFMINISKGTGIKGLSGIKPKSRQVVRPLLFADRSKIETYAISNNVQYREDSSNHSDKYYRNFIRHKILPVCQELNPGFKNNILDTIKILKSTSSIFYEKISEVKEQIIQEAGNKIFIDIKKLQNLSTPDAYLYEFLFPYGFNYEQVINIISSMDKQSGKKYLSQSHILVKDRDKLIISKNEISDHEFYIIGSNRKIEHPLSLNCSIISNSEKLIVPKERNIAWLDADKLVFPLKIRKWEKGDHFVPLGMSNFKKLSDFFSDNKFSIIDKSETWILTSESDIVWVVNHRIDNRYKVTNNTKNIFEVNS